MGVVYVGDTDFALDEEESGSPDQFGLYRTRRPLRGNSELLWQALRALRKGTPHPDLPSLKLARDPAFQRGPRFSTIECEYVGLLTDALPSPIRSMGLREATSQVNREGSAETADIFYRAPTTTYRYILRRQPKKPIFAGRLLQTEMDWEVLEYRGPTGTDGQDFHEVALPTASTITRTAFVPNRYNYARTVVTSMFDAQEVGDYWEVTEQNEGRIRKIDRADLPSLLPGLSSPIIDDTLTEAELAELLAQAEEEANAEG